MKIINEIAKPDPIFNARMEELLPGAYFHVIFTLPHELSSLIYQNQKLLYDLFFKASSATLLQFGKDPKNLGAKLGLLGILHTWGQKLWYHPHIHYIVPSGGISIDGNHWVSSKYKGDFLFRVEPMSDVFRGKFIHGLKKLWSEKELQLDGKIEYLQNEIAFEALITKSVKNRWVVFSRPPFDGPERVLRYLARYTHRVAITDHRLKHIEDDQIQFEYKDYNDHDKTKICKLSSEKFIQRFLFHVLPEGFQKIRYYGTWAGPERKSQLEKAYKLADEFKETLPTSEQILLEIFNKLLTDPVINCPCCDTGIMKFAGASNIKLSSYYDSS